MTNQFPFLLAIAAILSALLSSCKIYAPVFKTVENVHYENLENRGFKLGAEAVFDNPNKVKCTIKDIEVNVILDKKLIGILGEKTDVEVIKGNEFRIPLGIMIKPEGTILDGIKALWGIFVDKESELSFIGKIKVKILGFTVPIPIKYQRRFKLSELKKK